MPIENVFNFGTFPDSFKYFIINAATKELSNPPDKKVPIGLSLSILLIVLLYNSSAVIFKSLVSSYELKSTSSVLTTGFHHLTNC